MTNRTALHIRCSTAQAAKIREGARAEHRSISGYLLNLLEASLWIDEKFGKGLTPSSHTEVVHSSRVKGGRTGILLRCSGDEAARIRRGAARRKMSISRFVLLACAGHWTALGRREDSASDIR